MLTRLRLRNFKAWGDQLWDPGLELAPITLLLGPNSAGKTSILQVPLLLKQTFDSPDRTLDLNLGGQPVDLVDLGSFESVIHQHDTRRELAIGLSLAQPRRDCAQNIEYAVSYRLAGSAPALQRLELPEFTQAIDAHWSRRRLETNALEHGGEKRAGSRR